MSRFRSLLLVIATLGVITTVTGEGTFASFSATTENASTFATGTLVLSNTVDSGTTCFSTGGGATDLNSNSDCDSVVPAGIRKPNDVVSSTLVLVNEGSLAGTLSAHAPTCTTVDAPGESFHGTADLCPQVLVQVQEYANDTFGMFAALPSCVYPVSTSAACGWSYASLAQLVTDTATTPITTAAPTLTAGAERYVMVRLWWIDLGGSHNSAMGRQAELELEWNLVQ
jgi:hypothetical protein